MKTQIELEREVAELKKKLKKKEAEELEAAMFGYMTGRVGRHYGQYAASEMVG